MVEYYQRRSLHEPLEQLQRPYGTSGLWVHVPDRRVDLRELAEHYSLDANVLRDVLDFHELPRSEVKDGVSYTFLRLPSKANSRATVPLLAVVTDHHFFTISPHAAFSPKDIDVFITTRANKPPALLTAVVAGVVAEYERRINAIEEKISKSRTRLRQREVKNADFIEFVTVNDRLNEYRSSLQGILGVTEQLHLNRRGMFRPRDVEAIEDIAQHIQQLLASTFASIRTIDSIQSAYSTIANNLLNQRMKLLTAITILLAIPNVFYGMYGMNVELPIQHEAWAYPAIVGFTVLLILLVLILAKRFRLF